MKLNVKSTLVFVVVLALIAGLAYTTIYGVRGADKEVDGEVVPGYIFAPVGNQIKYGLDLTGGVYTVLEAQDSPEDPVTDEKMARAIAIIRQRVDGLGVAEPVITREGDRRIRIELPGVKNTEEAVNRIGQTAQLRFLDPNGNVVLTGENVREAGVSYDTRGAIKVPVVTLKFDAEGTTKFAAATKEFIGQIIYIVLDDEVISYPTVQDEITTGEAIITGQRDIEEASYLATLIRAGSLPLVLTEEQTSLVGPTLGMNAMEKSITAGMIGIAIVLLFMMIFYRVPGIIASISLILYVTIVLGALATINAVLTLPGIAGLILSIGMAVDANVIIFERLKEELRAGKTLRPAIDAAFSRAFRAIIDSNVTTLIAGFVLYNFGTGPIRGFALVLIIGIAASMFTAIIATKYLLKLFVSTNITKNAKLFGQ